ncbi:MAG: translational GTPase TypA [Planctomycetes bacterium]|nr:translational GTPase TypA [Planctomycetota bacterium]
MTAKHPDTAARRDDVRNIAIIAHVDHGKTTLLDGLLRQGGAFRANQQVADCVMDSNDQERERGITILAKNCAVTYPSKSHGDIRVNIVDTPGHADFGGEVERVLRMADGALVLVDAFEGPLPQTRFVLRKAIQTGLKLILVVNKIDKPGCEPDKIADGIFDLMVELGAADWQLDFPVVYGSGRMGFMDTDLEVARGHLKGGGDLMPLFDAIVSDVPGPRIDADAPLRMQVSNIDHNDFVGRMGIGRIFSGVIRPGQAVAVVSGPTGVPRKGRVLQLHRFSGLGREEIKEARAGDVVLVTGLEQVGISDTICDPDHPVALPPIPIDEPTIKMTFGVSTSPIAGTEGKPLQSRELRARLDREAQKNVAMRFADTDQPDVFEVAGRGVLHLAVLIETMRRENYELQVGPPRVIFREVDGERHEPIEMAVVEVPEVHASKVMNLMLTRRAELRVMETKGNFQHLEFTIPSRGLMGLRNLLLSATQGEAVLNTMFLEYGPYRGDLERRANGAIVSQCAGEVVAYALFQLQDRGTFFSDVGEPLYEGQIVGENNKDNELIVNLTKEKKLTNVRSSGADEAIRITPPRRFSLEEALEYIKADDLVEVTPKSIRLRKAMLKETDRKRASRGGE